MAFVRVSSDRTWIAEQGMLDCPQIPEVVLADDPYFNMDFSNVLDQDTKISSVATPTEPNSKTVTYSDEDISADGKVVSWKATGMTPAGDFEALVAVTLSTGTAQVVSKQGRFKAA